jgi:hypothetical protein
MFLATDGAGASNWPGSVSVLFGSIPRRRHAAACWPSSHAPGSRGLCSIGRTPLGRVLVRTWTPSAPPRRPTWPRGYASWLRGWHVGHACSVCMVPHVLYQWSRVRGQMPHWRSNWSVPWRKARNRVQPQASARPQSSLARPAQASSFTSCRIDEIIGL